MTRYAWAGEEADFDEVLDAATTTKAEAAVARSFEPYLWFAFDHVVASDAGLFHPATP
ncbi:MAG: hypothetical protein ABR562_04545 [Thermoplasmatota archaeon]